MLLVIYVLSAFTACALSQTPGSASATGPSVFQCNCGTEGFTRPSLVQVSRTNTLGYDKVLKFQVEEIAALFFNAPRSCDHISNTSSSGWYTISPDPGRMMPFHAFCDFTDGKSETVIYHSSMNEIKASSCLAPRCSKHKIVYNTAMPQIVALINQSTDCKQYIKYRCNNTFLLEGHCGAWLSRNGTPQFYWGGASSKKDGFCACGEKKTCTVYYKNCNCDQNDFPETSDEGYLTDKDTLPVTELQFGDLDNKIEHGYHTVGPLRCWGRI